MKIAFVINSLRLGGAEKTVVEMANYWASKGWQITIYTLSNYPKAAGLHISDNVQLVPLSAPFLSLRRHLQHSKPDVVIPFIDQCALITTLVTIGMSLKIIAAERIYPASHTIVREHYPIFIRNFAALLRRYVYKLTTALVVQTDAAKDYFLPCYKKKIYVVPNALFINEGQVADVKIGEKTIVAMGRLVPQKGFDYLIEEFSLIANKHPNWKLAIVGEGRERETLQSLINSKNLEQQIKLLGQTSKPEAVLKGAEIFVLSSRYEGYPNVLCQAMACGVAVIATDCLAGPRDIITNDVDGLLVKSGAKGAIATQLERLINDETERKRLADAAKRIISRLNPSQIMSQWEKIIKETADE